MRHFCASVVGTSTITIFIAAIEVMTEPSTSVATSIAAAASFPTALFIIVAIVFVLFITMVTGVMTARCGLLIMALALARDAFDAIYPIEMASRLARGRYVCVLLSTAAAERSSITPGDFTSPACGSFSLYVYVCLSIYLIAVRTYRAQRTGYVWNYRHRLKMTHTKMALLICPQGSKS